MECEIISEKGKTVLKVTGGLTGRVINLVVDKMTSKCPGKELLSVLEIIANRLKD